MHSELRERRNEIRSRRGQEGLHLGRTRTGACETRRPESQRQGNAQGRHTVRSGSRCVEITISFDLTLESVPEFRLFSRRKAPMRSGQLAHLTGVSTDTLRHYERLGLLPLPQRTAGNYREYSPASQQRGELIQRALT